MAVLWFLLLVDLAAILLGASLILGLSFMAVWAAASLYCTVKNVPHSPGVLAVAREGEIRPDPGLPLLHDARWH